MRWLTRAPELRTALVVSGLLVVARSLVYAGFEYAHFDSDQAIVGLMAKHLSEGRAFPLFFLRAVLLAIGFLNREFVVYAVPVLLVGQAWSRTLFRMETLRVWLFSLVAFLAVWQSVQALVPFSDVMGPGSRGGPAAATHGSQLDSLSERVQIDLAGSPARTWRVVTRGVAGLVGGRRMPDSQWGRDWVGYALGIALLAAVLRVGRLWVRRAPTQTASFAWYLLGVGVMAAVGYAATRPGDEVMRRYILLSLFLPVGLTALWLVLEPNRRVRQAVVVLMLGWMTLSGVDNWRLWHRFSSGQEPDPMSEMVKAAETLGLSVVEAPYWRAYKLAFLTRERIKAASTDVIRITEYQEVAAAAGPSLMRLQDVPCPGGTSPGGWYLCPKPMSQ